MWMTEKLGGSDLSNTLLTVAVRQSNGVYRLYGNKWFTSTTDSEVSMALARIVDENLMK